jgi:isopentenyl-diphosphate delta-isomerase
MEEDVQGVDVFTGLSRYSLLHCALPEMSLSDVDMHSSFLTKSLTAPILLSAMTGGTKQAGEINQNLAQAAQAHGVAMGVGSQRAAIEQPDWEPTYQVRKVAPDIPLFANLGAVQLNYGYGLAECQRAVDMIEADGLILHLNALQECLQSGGNTDFRALLSKIESVCRRLQVPVIAKEVGWGISAPVARQLVEAGVAAIDVAGAGGTSWSQVEKYRSTVPSQGQIADAFASWGIPTALSIQWVRRELPKLPLIASGGIQTGVDVARAIALGADLVGIARPLLEAATRSAEETSEALGVLVDTLRVAMFASGTLDIPKLQRAPLLDNLRMTLQRRP